MCWGASRNMNGFLSNSILRPETFRSPTSQLPLMASTFNDGLSATRRSAKSKPRSALAQIQIRHQEINFAVLFSPAPNGFVRAGGLDQVAIRPIKGGFHQLPKVCGVDSLTECSDQLTAVLVLRDRLHPLQLAETQDHNERH